MILVDTSIWIEHFRKSEPSLVQLLSENHVIAHPMVIGELACGNLKQRTEVLPLLNLLPMSICPTDGEVLHFIEEQKIFGEGVGWVDANLLASCFLSHSLLWTRDKSLLKIAKRLNLLFL